MAQAAAQHALLTHFRVTDLKNVGLHIASVGTHALAGHPATEEMQTIAAGFGIDLSQHRATQADPQALAGASMVLAMEMSHIDWVQSRSNRAPVGLLGRADIDDPYGSGRAAYRRAGREIVEAVQLRLSEMIALAG